jgi:PAS domain S-box-containing protein
MDKMELKILLIEDNRGDARLVQSLLKIQSGKQVIHLTHVDTLIAGLSYLVDADTDLILLDMCLPDSCGPETFEPVHACAPHVPVVILTGLDDEAMAQQVIQAGAQDYLLKNELEPRLLLRTIRYAIERSQAQHALRASEYRYRLIAENATDMISRHTPTGIYLYVSPSCHDLLGYAPADMLGCSAYDFFHPDDVPAIQTSHNTILDQPVVYTVAYRIRRKDGQYIWFETTSKTVVNPATGNIEEILAISRDITARKQAEAQLDRRNRQLALFNQIVAAANFDSADHSLLPMVCRELAQLLPASHITALLLSGHQDSLTVAAEYPADSPNAGLNQSITATGNSFFEKLRSRRDPFLLPTHTLEPLLAALPPAFGARRPPVMLVVPLLADANLLGCLTLETASLNHFSIDELGVVGSVADHVAAALSRAYLARHQRQLSAAIDQTADSVIITDIDGITFYVNPAFEKITGYSRHEAVGQSPAFLKSHQHEPQFYADLWATITAGREWHGRFVNRKKNGDFYTEDATITPIFQGGVISHFVKVGRDVTRELQLEEQYYRAQKLEAIGQLTGGIAHDFNNLLTAINGFAELLQTKLSAETSQRVMVDNILKSGRSAAELVNHLLVFSRKQVIKPQVVNLNTVVSQMAGMLPRMIAENITLETHLTPDLWPVKADPTQLEQIVVNLVVNARDAMPEGGRLAIHTANVELDQTYAAAHVDAPAGDYVLLSVSDTGVGMNKEVQARIFEPFFTTKAKGSGTGLGLSTVFGIVKQSGGNIWPYSEEGLGTTFKIYLPRTLESLAPAARANGQSKMPTGHETILLVEDNVSVRELVSNVLSGLGYAVLEAADGQQALKVANGKTRNIDLLLTDVVIPKLNGKMLSDQLREVNQDIKTLFMSGYPQQTITHHGVLEPDCEFIQKPFSPLALARRVREVLDR